MKHNTDHKISAYRLRHRSSSFMTLMATLSLAGILGGCGGEAIRDVDSTGGSSTTNPTPTPTITVTSTPTPTVTVSPTPDPNLLPAIKTSFTLYGQSSLGAMTYSYRVETDNILKIKVKAGPAVSQQIPMPSLGTNATVTANYSCVSYTITVLGQSVQTNPLAVGGVANSMCPNTEQVIDFSGRLSAGHNTVDIGVSAPRYDFYCMLCYSQPYLFPYGCYNECPVKPIFKNHAVTGNLNIQVNGTGID